MIRNRSFDIACVALLAFGIALVAALPALGRAGIVVPNRNDSYLEELFRADTMHTIDIEHDAWNSFIDQAAEERYERVDVTIDGERLSGVGLRAKGNNSLGHVARRGLERYSLKIEFDHFEDSLSYHGLDKLSLDAAFQDNSYLKNYLALDMMRFMGVPTPATSFVFVTVNGEAWGVFLAIEEVEDTFAERVWGQDHGMLYKPDYRSLEDENADVALRYIGDDPELYPGIFDSARFPTTYADEVRLVRSLRMLAAGSDLERAINVDEVLRYFAVQVFCANLDSYVGSTGHNYLLYENDGTLEMIPWDYNLAFGTYALGRKELPDEATPYVNLPIDEPAATEVLAKRPLFTQLMAVDEYRARYHSYLDELVETYVSSGQLAQTIAQARELIAPYVAQDPTAFVTYEEFLAGIDAIERFCMLRAESIRGQLTGDIPATWDGQRQHPKDLVDASALDLADLGELSDLDQ